MEYEIFDDDHLKNLKCICSEFGIEDEITHENYYGTYSKKYQIFLNYIVNDTIEIAGLLKNSLKIHAERLKH